MGKPREREMIRAYIAQRYPDQHVIFGCPLGPVPEVLTVAWGARKALRVGRGLRPEVDALVIQNRSLIMVEAKVVKWMDGLSKLPVYKGLVPTTPELEEYRGYPVRMILCTPWANESIRASAEGVGVEIDEFSTPEVDAYIEEMGKYWSREYQAARQEKKRAREILGLE